MTDSPLQTVDNVSQTDDKTLSGQTTAALREAIIKGEIAPGEKLNEPKLAEQFQVSRGRYEKLFAD